MLALTWCTFLFYILRVATLAVSPKPIVRAPVVSRAGERLLFMLSSFDRGERLANWNGEDKMHIILQVHAQSTHALGMAIDRII
jgi:hypothetical protein